MLKLKAFSFSLIVILIVSMVMQGPPTPELMHLSGQTMGTTYNVKYPENKQIDAQVLQADIDQLLVHINKLMSTYDPESELSRFNQWSVDDTFPLSPETLLVLKEAKRLGALSQGVLDVTVGPLVNLWGFGPEAEPQKVPPQQTIQATIDSIGLDKLQLTESGARKLTPNLYVDLSTIAKGYGVDKVAQLLEEQGIHNYLVEIGGEMRVAGSKPDQSAWLIAVEKPVSQERAVQKILAIGDNAIATSGDYRNYYERDGMRYSHLIDPRNGYPIQHNLVSVTVVHPSSMTADGLATALNVMGKSQALALAEQNNWPVLLITREKDQFIEYTTANFEQFVVKPN